MTEISTENVLPTHSSCELEILHTIKCPISLQIFNEPVVASDGHVYEKNEIIHWLQNNQKSPMTPLKIV